MLGLRLPLGLRASRASGSHSSTLRGKHVMVFTSLGTSATGKASVQGNVWKACSQAPNTTVQESCRCSFRRLRRFRVHKGRTCYVRNCRKLSGADGEDITVWVPPPAGSLCKCRLKAAVCGLSLPGRKCQLIIHYCSCSCKHTPLLVQGLLYRQKRWRPGEGRREREREMGGRAEPFLVPYSRLCRETPVQGVRHPRTAGAHSHTGCRARSLCFSPGRERERERERGTGGHSCAHTLAKERERERERASATRRSREQHPTKQAFHADTRTRTTV